MSEDESAGETEESISQHLQDLGMLEDGMTADDKHNLWAVIKRSQDTAKAEEQNRQKQARQALQFDQVSSRSVLSFGPETRNDSLIEEISFPLDHKSAEDEKKATVAAVLPQQRSTPPVSLAPSQCTTATVLPLCQSHEKDLSQNQNTVNISLSFVSSCSRSPTADVSQNEQIISATQDSQTSHRCVVEPLARRLLRPRVNIGTNNIAKQNPRNNLASLNTQNSSSQGLSNEVGDLPQTVQDNELVTGPPKSEKSFRIGVTASAGTRTVTGLSRMSSSPIPVVQSSEHSDQDNVESSVSEVQESSEIKGVQKNFPYYQKSDTKQRIGGRPEVNEDCCEKNDFSALREEPVDRLDVEKCVCASSTLGNVPSPSSDSLSDITANCNSGKDAGKKRSQDREMNINPFNCDRSNYERSFKVRKMKRACSRLPFYIPPYKMDIYTYITYFKRSIKDQAARLLEVQRRNPRCVPWGEPIVVGESRSRGVVALGWGEQKSKSLTPLQRSNFQDHKDACQLEHAIYEDPDMQSDDLFFADTRREKVIVESQQDGTDDLFDAMLQDEKSSDKREEDNNGDNSHNFIAGSRQGPVKRKSDSSDEQIFDEEDKSREPLQKRLVPGPWITVKEEAPSVAKRRKSDEALSVAEAAHNCGDSDGELEPSEKHLQRRCAVKSYVKKKIQKNVSSNQNQSVRKGGGMDGEAGACDNNDCATAAVSDTDSCPESCQGTEEIRPGPVKLRRLGRRLLRQNQVETKDREETGQRENDGVQVDVTGACEVGSSDIAEQEAAAVACPICRKTFPIKAIEAHASECNEYCEEEILPVELHVSESSISPEMTPQNSRGAMSKKCWSDFNGIREFEGDHITIFRTRQHSPLQAQQDELPRVPLSPIHCFVPISEQQDSDIDYHRQFRVAATVRQNPTRNQARKRRTKWKKRKRVKVAKRKKVGQSCG